MTDRRVVVFDTYAPTSDPSQVTFTRTYAPNGRAPSAVKPAPAPKPPTGGSAIMRPERKSS